MKITQIDLKHYRGFRSEHRLELGASGKHVLVYGENGSGKSSLFHALKQFLNADAQQLNFSDEYNIFESLNDAYIKLSLLDGTNSRSFEWSNQNSTDISDPAVLTARKFSGFLEYRDILKTHLLTPGDLVNLFDLLVDTLLVDIENPFAPGFTFGQLWKNLNANIPTDNRRRSETASFQAQLNQFNDGLEVTLQQLETRLAPIFAYFNYGNVQLRFDRSNLVYKSRDRDHPKNYIGGQQVILQVKFGPQDLNGKHPQFLNEAKLSAIGISIYLAALQLIPMSSTDSGLLVLDDVLIGLDMSNRLHVIDILRDHFLSKYQIFLLTYDREWFQILCQHFVEVDGRNWKAFEFYCSNDSTLEIPVVASRDEAIKEYLSSAKKYLDSNDYKAAAIYARTAFEATLKNYCDKRSVPVPYKENGKDLKADKIWEAVEGRVPAVIAQEIKRANSVVMNPLSHSRVIAVFKTEVQKAIHAVTQLHEELTSQLSIGGLEIIDSVLTETQSWLQSAPTPAITQIEVERAIQAIIDLRKDLTSRTSGARDRSLNSVLIQLTKSKRLQLPQTERDAINRLTIDDLQQLETDLSSISALSDLRKWLHKKSILIQLQLKVGRLEQSEKTSVEGLADNVLNQLEQDLSSFSTSVDLMNWLNTNTVLSP